MPTTKSIPKEAFGELGLRAGDSLRIVAVMDNSFLVTISHQDEGVIVKGSAREWVKSARGTIKLAPGESADDIRIGL